MTTEELQKLAQEMGSIQKELAILLQRKQEMTNVLEQHWAEVVAPKLNKDMKEKGYWFDEKQNLNFYAQGKLNVELYPQAHAWWIETDEYRGWVNSVRADELTGFVNSTVAVQQLIADFPNIVVRVINNPCDSLDDPEDVKLVADVDNL